MTILKPPVGCLINPAHPLSVGMAGCWVFNEGSGSTANDSSGNGNHGSIVGGPVWTDNGLTLDGSNDRIECTNPFLPRFSNALSSTVAFRCKVLSAPAARGMLYCGASGFNSLGKGLSVRIQSASTARFAYTIADGVGTGNRTNEAVGPAINSWVSHVFSYSAVDFLGTCYVDGAFSGQGNYAGEVDVTNTYQLFIGYNENGYINADLSDVMIWNRALSAAEIASLYADPYQMFRRPIVGLPWR